MTFRGLLLLSTVALGVSLSEASSQDSSATQMQMIRETARDICDTVKDTSGRKTKKQVEFNVKGQVGGLIKRLAGAGIQGAYDSDLSDEFYEGISQEALADALQGDRRCRENLFNKMFDEFFGGRSTFSSSPNERDDINTVRDFTLGQGKSIVMEESGKIFSVGSISGSLAKVNIDGGPSEILRAGQAVDYTYSDQKCRIIVLEVDNRSHSAKFISKCDHME